MISTVAHGILGTAYRQDVIVDDGVRSSGSLKALYDVRRLLSTQYDDDTPMTGWAMQPAPTGMWLSHIERAFDANYAPAYVMVSFLVPNGTKLRIKAIQRVEHCLMVNHTKFMQQSVVIYDANWSFLQKLSQDLQDDLVKEKIYAYSKDVSDKAAFWQDDMTSMLLNMWNAKFRQFSIVFCGKRILSQDKNFVAIDKIDLLSDDVQEAVQDSSQTQSASYYKEQYKKWEELLKKKEYDNALQCLLNSAKGDYGEALGALAYQYFRGTVYGHDFKLAEQYARRGATLGNNSCQLWLGQILRETGRKEEALQWFEKSGKRHGWSAFLAGEMYEKGEGVQKNLLQAVYWYRISAKNHLNFYSRNAQDALRRLGVDVYEKEEYMKLIQEALIHISHRSPKQLYDLEGRMWRIEKRPDQFAALLHSARQGYPPAQEMLGEILLSKEAIDFGIHINAEEFKCWTAKATNKHNDSLKEDKKKNGTPEKNKNKKKTTPKIKKRNKIDWTGVAAGFILAIWFLCLFFNFFGIWLFMTISWELKIGVTLLTGVGYYIVDHTNGFLRGCGIVAILLSTALAIYGLCGGFLQPERHIQELVVIPDKHSIVNVTEEDASKNSDSITIPLTKERENNTPLDALNSSKTNKNIENISPQEANSNSPERNKIIIDSPHELFHHLIWENIKDGHEKFFNRFEVSNGYLRKRVDIIITYSRKMGKNRYMELYYEVLKDEGPSKMGLEMLERKLIRLERLPE